MGDLSLCELLEQLLVETQKYDQAQKALEEAEEAVKNANAYICSKVAKFDATYKEEFISSVAGERPKALGKWNPLNLSKKRKLAASKAESEYASKRKAAEKKYYEKYGEKRTSIEEADKREKEKRISEADAKYQEAKIDLESAKSRVSSSFGLAESLRKTEIIEKLIVFFKEGRVDTMKEAVNMYYDEKRKDEEAFRAEQHRKHLEEILEEQNNTIQEVVEKVEEVKRVSEEAYSRADEAYDRADEAYDRADEAYDRASGSDI